MLFNEEIATFKKVTSVEAKEGLQSQSYILFIGRATCPFCNRFAPKLRAVSDANQLAICFLDSDDFNDLGIAALRQEYNVPTVPGLLVAKEGEVRVVCDSSLSEEEILNFIN